MPPYISLVVPTLGLKDYLALFFRTLALAYTEHEVEVCLGTSVPFEGVSTFGIPVKVAHDPNHPQFSHAMDRAVLKAEGEWIGTMNDDVAFIPGWDDLEGKVREDRVLAWDLLEPGNGSWPPPFDAGRTPDKFRSKDAVLESIRRRRPKATPGNFFGLYVFHRSLLERVPYAERTGLDAPGCQDIDFAWRLHLEFPGLCFGQLGLCLYHFQNATVNAFPWTRPDGEETQMAFQARHGISTTEAYRRIDESSVALWRD